MPEGSSSEAPVIEAGAKPREKALLLRLSAVLRFSLRHHGPVRSRQIASLCQAFWRRKVPWLCPLVDSRPIKYAWYTEHIVSGLAMHCSAPRKLRACDAKQRAGAPDAHLLRRVADVADRGRGSVCARGRQENRRSEAGRSGHGRKHGRGDRRSGCCRTRSRKRASSSPSPISAKGSAIPRAASSTAPSMRTASILRPTSISKSWSA